MSFRYIDDLFSSSIKSMWLYIVSSRLVDKFFATFVKCSLSSVEYICYIFLAVCMSGIGRITNLNSFRIYYIFLIFTPYYIPCHFPVITYLCFIQQVVLKDMHNWTKPLWTFLCFFHWTDSGYTLPIALKLKTIKVMTRDQKGLRFFGLFRPDRLYGPYRTGVVRCGFFF